VRDSNTPKASEPGCTPWLQDADVTLYHGDAREVLCELPDQSVDCVVTSPPYWQLRDYGNSRQLGLEATPEQYVEAVVQVFGEVRRVLSDHGTVWLVIGDTYAAKRRGSDNGWDKSRLNNPGRVQKRQRISMNRDRIPAGCKEKDLIGVPWMAAFALRAAGWWLRSEVTWCKPNGMPESAKDRPTTATESIFLLAKSPTYYFDQDAVREPHHKDGRYVTRVVAGDGSVQHRNGERWPNDGRNVRDWWVLACQPIPDEHFAPFPLGLASRCILASCPPGGTVLDPFAGAGTSLLAARQLGRKALGIELTEASCEIASRRLAQQSLLAEASA